MSKKVEFINKVKKEIGRDLTAKEKTYIEVAYENGIKEIDWAIDFMDCGEDIGPNTNPYEIISDYLDIYKGGVEN